LWKEAVICIKTGALGMDLKMGGANFWIGQVDLRNVPERGSCGRGPEIGRSLSKLKSNKNKKYTIVSLDLLIYRTFSSFNLEIQLFIIFLRKTSKVGGRGVLPFAYPPHLRPWIHFDQSKRVDGHDHHLNMQYYLTQGYRKT
jgi:hypothetical protein